MDRSVGPDESPGGDASFSEDDSAVESAETPTSSADHPRGEQPSEEQPLVEHGRHLPTPTDDEPGRGDEPRVPESLGFEVIVDDRDASVSDIEAAERYLATQVLRILGVESGALDASTQAVADLGMVMITIENGEPNAAETLERLLDLDEPSRSSNIDRGLRAVLDGRISPWRLHRWIEKRFFLVQTSEFTGNPLVWHLSSSDGAFQALIRADKLDLDHLQALLYRVGKTIDRLTVAVADAGTAGDWDQVEVIEARFAEVRSFNDLILDLLQRQWQVGGDLDRAAKLAVMTDLGVIRVQSAIPPSDLRSGASANGASA